MLEARAYFLSSDFDSLGEDGVVGDMLLELELEAALPPVAPVPEVVVSPGAGVGEGAVVEGEGAVGAGDGGGVTIFSSFLPQAVRPSASSAAMRSERFMFYTL